MSPRAQRTLVQKLAPIVLGFEAIVVFLAGLTVFGLGALSDFGVPSWWGIAGGVVVALAMIAVAGAITRPWAIATGWVLQAIVALSAFLVPAIGVVALIFGGMWAYATIMGARIDARTAARAGHRSSEQHSADTDTESE